MSYVKESRAPGTLKPVSLGKVPEYQDFFLPISLQAGNKRSTNAVLGNVTRAEVLLDPDRSNGVKFICPPKWVGKTCIGRGTVLLVYLYVTVLYIAHPNLL